MISTVQAARTVRQSSVVARADFRTFYSWKTWIFGWLIRLLCQVVFYTMVGVMVGDRSYTVYIVVGAAMLICVAETMLTVASTCWDRLLGTQQLLVASPVEPGFHFFGRSVQWPVSASVTTSIALLTVPPFFGVTWSLGQVPVLVAIVVVTSFASYCLALFLGSVALVFPGGRNVISTVTVLYITAFTGAMVPLEFWPTPTVWIAQTLPVTHGLDAVRAVQTGGPMGEVGMGIVLTAVTGLAWFIVAALAFRWIFARVRTGARMLD